MLKAITPLRKITEGLVTRGCINTQAIRYTAASEGVSVKAGLWTVDWTVDWTMDWVTIHSM